MKAHSSSTSPETRLTVWVGARVGCAELLIEVVSPKACSQPWLSPTRMSRNRDLLELCKLVPANRVLTSAQLYSRYAGAESMISPMMLERFAVEFVVLKPGVESPVAPMTSS